MEGRLREEYLDRACAGDAELRRHVELLLGHDLDDDEATVYDRPGLGRELLASALAKEEEEANRPPPGLRPETIGRYTIRERIAEGGMGVVYLADQDHPRRQVALKVIRPGVFTDELLQRFEFEADLLGRLQHVGIASIYDAGEAETEAGRQPYYAMEYIRGVPLTEYAEREGLGTEARLRLLARICDAVHHAHQKGIVHRDLKPANILVVNEETSGDATPGSAGRDPIGQPKVLDFGVSRLIQDRPADVERLTQTGFVVGTVAYMSPEQAAGDQTVDTRSDVYSLGVIGFELLSGRLPHACRELPFVQALRMIQERPAPRLESVSRDCRGDVSIIIDKALRTDRDRRYSSAAALAEDIRRYLAHEPIAARPPTLRYQMGRFVRRNKAVVAGATTAVLALVIGLVMAVLAQREESRQRVIAEEQTVEARAAAYAALLQVAATLGESGDVIPARQRLAATPPELRGWEWEYLTRRFEDEIAWFPMTILDGPRPFVARDGSRALVAVGKRTFRLLDLATGTGTDYPVPFDALSVVLLGDGRTALASVPGRGILRLDLDGATDPSVFLATDTTAGRLRLGPNGRRLLAAVGEMHDPDRAAVLLIDLDTGVVRSRFPVSSWPTVMDLSPDGTLVAIGNRQGQLRVFEVDTGRIRLEVEAQGDWARDVRFSPGGTRLAITDAANGIRVFDVASGRRRMTSGHDQYTATTLWFGPDDKTLVSGHQDGKIRRWRVETGACVHVTSSRDSGTAWERGILDIAVREGGMIAVGIEPNGVSTRPATPPLPATERHAGRPWQFVYDVDFSPCGRHLVSASWDGTVRIWDVATRRLLTTTRVAEAVWFAQHSPDGTRLLVGSRRGYGAHRFELWDAVTLRRLRTLDRESRHISGLFVPAGPSIVIGANREILVLDPVTFEVRAEHEWEAEVWSLALSPDGSRIACGFQDGRLVILDARTFETLKDWEAHEGRVSALAFQPDGRRLASGASDATVRLWDLRDGDADLSIVVPESREIFAIRFTEDGRRLLVGSRFPGVHVWDATTGRELLRLKGHEDYVHGLALSPDHRIVVSGSGDGTVRFWDARPLVERIEARDRMLRAEDAARERVEGLVRNLGSVEKALEAIGLSDTPARNVALRLRE